MLFEVDPQSGDATIPPAYSEVEVTQPTRSLESQYHVDFSALDLQISTAMFPTVDTYLVHLKLLRGFEVLRNKIGTSDGLWDIWDLCTVDASHDVSDATNSNDLLIKIREKRWAIYVARAVDRYEAWWRSFVPHMLTEADILLGGTDRALKYEGFTSSQQSSSWTDNMLPPFDVLLVWHTHMLNPRLFLEDCIRYGYSTFWRIGITWALINDAINEITFEYDVSHDCKTRWTEITGRAWDNRQDILTKRIRCPSCSTEIDVAWTTCGRPRDTKQRNMDLCGQGYGDGNLKSVCQKCSITINEDILRVAKFRDDVKGLFQNDWPMPGTILDCQGLTRKQNTDSDQLFPNRLVRKGLLVETSNIFQAPTSVTMVFIRDKIQEVTAPTEYRHSNDRLKEIDKGTEGVFGKMASHKLSRKARMHTRAMMSRYWENSSIFSLDLRNAVMRQGVFVRKMYKIDWLHSPMISFTMEKARIKYERFFDIASSHPDQVITPTLDIDLAWHTHQLNPQSYHAFSVEKCGSFIDHNDKVDEDKLAISFDWMSKIYQDKYGEVYSECTCWFCESPCPQQPIDTIFWYLLTSHGTGIRYMHTSKLKRLFAGNKDRDRSSNLVLESWHTSGQVTGAHISSHAAVQAVDERSLQRKTERMIFHNNLNDAHEKTLRRSTKAPERSFFSASTSSTNNSSTLGSRGEDHCTHWGKKVELSGPWSSETAAVLAAEMYPSHPGIIQTRPGHPGACAVGTCGGSAGCGSGAIALCGTGCTGMGRNFFGAGCQGIGNR